MKSKREIKIDAQSLSRTKNNTVLHNSGQKKNLKIHTRKKKKAVKKMFLRTKNLNTHNMHVIIFLFYIYFLLIYKI